MFTTFVATLRVQSRNCCNCFGHSRRWAVLPSDHLFSTFLVWWSGGPFQELNSFLNVYCSGHPPLEAEACARTMSSMIGFNCTDDACAQASQGFCNLGPLVCLNRTRDLCYFSYGFGVLHVAVITRCFFCRFRNYAALAQSSRETAFVGMLFRLDVWPSTLFQGPLVVRKRFRGVVEVRPSSTWREYRLTRGVCKKKKEDPFPFVFRLSWETSTLNNYHPEDSKHSGSRRIEFSSKHTTF